MHVCDSESLLWLLLFTKFVGVGVRVRLLNTAGEALADLISLLVLFCWCVFNWWCCCEIDGDIWLILWFLWSIGFIVGGGGGVHEVEWTEEHLFAIEFCCCTEDVVTGTSKFSLLLLSTFDGEFCLLLCDKFNTFAPLFGDTGFKQFAFEELLLLVDCVEGDIGNVLVESIELFLLLLLLLLILDGTWDWLIERWCCPPCTGDCCCWWWCTKWFNGKKLFNDGVSHIDDKADVFADSEGNCETLNGKCWEFQFKSECISDVCKRLISWRKKKFLNK